MNKEYEFLNKLADLMDEYGVEIESDYEFVGVSIANRYDNVKKYLDFDFQESPYTTIHIEDVYINSDDIREIAEEWK